MQGQEFGPAKWGIAQRMRGATDSAIDGAFNGGEILRTHMMRPTWHFVAPDDLRWMLALTSPRVQAMNAPQYRTLELTPAVRSKAIEVIATALAGATHLTRQELRVALARRRIHASGQRLAYVVMNAELEGVICSGPLRGKAFTYALIDERVPPSKPLAREEALAALTRRFFASHGPAQAKDFAWWSGLAMADVKAGIASLGRDLQSAVVDGLTFYGPSRGRGAVKLPAVHLLPVYDEHVVAYRDHGPSLDDRIRAKVEADRDVFFRHLVIRNGLVIGGWRSASEDGIVRVRAELLTSITRVERAAMDGAATRLGRFLKAPAVLEVIIKR